MYVWQAGTKKGASMSIILSDWWNSIQRSLLPGLSDALDEALTDKHKQLAAILEVVRVEDHIVISHCWRGRPAHDLRKLARAFVAKAVYNMPTTGALIECLRTDANL